MTDDINTDTIEVSEYTHDASVWVTTSDRIARLSICRSCPSYWPNGKMCSECGCFVPNKVNDKGDECPRGKW